MALSQSTSQVQCEPLSWRNNPLPNLSAAGNNQTSMLLSLSQETVSHQTRNNTQQCGPQMQETVPFSQTLSNFMSNSNSSIKSDIQNILQARVDNLRDNVIQHMDRRLLDTAVAFEQRMSIQKSKLQADILDNVKLSRNELKKSRVDLGTLDRSISDNFRMMKSRLKQSIRKDIDHCASLTKRQQAIIMDVLKHERSQLLHRTRLLVRRLCHRAYHRRIRKAKFQHADRTKTKKSNEMRMPSFDYYRINFSGRSSDFPMQLRTTNSVLKLPKIQHFNPKVVQLDLQLIRRRIMAAQLYGLC